MEVTVMEYAGQEKTCISVGVSVGRNRSTFFKQPGWQMTSAGLHSDDGQFFFDNEPRRLDAKFGPGDTVGVGVRLDGALQVLFFFSIGVGVRLDGALPVLFFTKNGQLLRYFSALTGVPPSAAEADKDARAGALPVLFFTKNGQLLRYFSALTGVPLSAAEADKGRIARYFSALTGVPSNAVEAYKANKGGLRFANLFPTIGIDSRCPIAVNCGAEPFVFDLAAAKHWPPVRLSKMFPAEIN
ncbi:hypothetical protein T484DRAFT_1833930 [Baffinella frigidus]|nr:hypothetical protein T484DRAFT_1833930 [Cryptophyta sp. CCMP2293]